jgi:MYXO-CTERM domain-containing protein
MKTRAALIVAALAGVASSTMAQSPQTQGTATWTIQAFRATPTTPGVWNSGVTVGATALTAADTLQPNQGIQLRVSFSLSGTPGGWDVDNEVPLGSPLTWNSSLGGSGSGGLGGLWNADLNVTSSEPATWSNQDSSLYAVAVRRQILSPYAAGGGHGIVNGSTAGTGPAALVSDIQPAQFGADSHTLDHGNNVVAWRSLWVPGSYNDRTVNFSVLLGSLGLLTQVYAVDANGNATPVALNVATAFGPAASVHIVPTPSSLALLGLGGLIAARRRR